MAAPGAKKARVAPSADVEICADPAARVAAVVGDAAKAAISGKGSFTIAIAGGSLVKMLGAMADMPGVEWDKWHVGWVDERCVPHADSESNYGGAQKEWLSKVPIPASQIYAIDETLCKGGGQGMAEASAKAYEKSLKDIPEAVLLRGADGMPSFDLLLLGFGPDGHICSLFPGHPLLNDKSGSWILPIWDSPKPPPERITLSLEAVNAASQIVLVGTGDGKKEIVRDAFTPGCQHPCRLALGAKSPEVRPTWILDKAAAALLPQDGSGSGYEVKTIA
eukprot:TRINITY_DN41559_c0_g1_i1.p1 TRINITY_DN41559_c0_g1~~TRINITY_DN41559_c0_g1_i1.p1  ORF type:complete len:294 (-),score=86.86 TRINITY_DN41559_c0_g1_i1:112-945(-)